MPKKETDIQKLLTPRPGGKPVTIKIQPDIITELKKLAARKSTTFAEQIRLALVKHIQSSK